MFGGYGGGSSVSSIPMDGRITPMPSTTAYIGELMNLQSAMQMRDLRNAEIRNQSIEADTHQRDLDASKGLGALIAAHTGAPPQAPQSPQTPPPQPQPGGASNSMASIMPQGAAGQDPGILRSPMPGTANADTGISVPPMPGTANVDPGILRSTGNMSPAMAPPQPLGMPSAAAAFQGLQQQHAVGAIHGYPVTDWQAARQDAYSKGWGPQFEKLYTAQRESETAALTQQRTDLENQASRLNLASQMIQPLATAAPGSTPDQLQELARTARNTLIANGVVTQDKLLDASDPKLVDQLTGLFQMGKSAPQTMNEHAQFLKNTQDAIQAGLKTGSEMNDQVNKWVANSQSADDVNHAMLIARSIGYTPQQIVQNFPVQRGPDGQPIALKDGSYVAQWSPEIKAQAAQSLVSPNDQARNTQELLQTAGSKLATAFSQGPAVYQQALGDFETQHPELKGTFSPNPKTRDQILMSGMPANQVETDAQRQERIGIAQSLANLRIANGGLTPGQGGVAGRFNQREIDNDQKRMDGFQDKAQTYWDHNQEINAALATPIGQNFADPQTTKDVEMTAGQQARLKAMAVASRTQALQYEAQAKGIRQKQGWGEFAKPAAGGAPATPPAPPVIAPPNPVAPPVKPPVPTPAPAPAAAPKPAPAPAGAPQQNANAAGVIAALRKGNVQFSAVDSADGMPIIVRNGQQYKVTAIDPDGTVHASPGKWGPKQ